MRIIAPISLLVALSAAAAWTAKASAQAAPASQPAHSPAALSAAAENQVRLALAETDLAGRQQRLQQASTMLGQAAQASYAPDVPSRQAASLHYRLRQMDVAMLLACEPYAARLMYLQGNSQDRKNVLALTAAWAGHAAHLAQEIQTLAERLRQPGAARDFVLVGPQLDELSTTLAYKSAWIVFYRAIALPPDDPQHKALLNEAAQAIQPFIQADDGGTKFWALLLAGMCARETTPANGNYKTACDLLCAAAVPAAPPAVQSQALFELTRAYAAGNDEPQAQLSLKSYAAKSIQLMPAQTVLWEARTATLAYAMARESARNASNADVSLCEFLNRHRDTETQEAFLEMLAHQCQDEPDIRKIASTHCLAMAAYALKSKSAHDLSRGREAMAVLLERADGSDGTARELRPLALWFKGAMLHAQQQPREAASLFAALARQYPQHYKAAHALQNAVRIYYELAQASEDDAALRLEFVQAMELFLNTPAATADSPAAQWNYELGQQCQKLAQTATGQERLTWLNKAAAAYGKVPASQPEYREALLNSLEVRCDTLTWEQPDGRAAQARQLDATLTSFITDIQSLPATDAKQSAPLRDLTARAQLRRAMLLDQYLDQSPRALTLLEETCVQWPDAPAIWACRHYQIRRLLELSRTQEAIACVEACRRQDPSQTQPLMIITLEQIRRQLADPSGGADTAQAAFRKAYLDFAEALYRTGRADAQNRYTLMQTYADALLENGRADDALEILQQCASLYESRPNAERNGADAFNIYGQARAMRLKKQYNESLAMYQRYVEGLDRRRYPQLYWRGELELCRTVLEGFSNQPARMRQLIVRLRQLAMEDAAMGGMTAQFHAVQELAERHADKAVSH